MSIMEGVVVTVKCLLVDNYIRTVQYSTALVLAVLVRLGLRRKLDANKRFEESTVRLHTGRSYRAVRDSK